MCLLMDIHTVFTLGAITGKASLNISVESLCGHCSLFSWT